MIASTSDKVISFTAARTARQLEQAEVSYMELSQRIDLCAHEHASLGAVVLLRQILLLSSRGEGSLSYTYLCKRMDISRRTLARYIEELEDGQLLRVRRSRLGKTNAVNQFEIDFNGPLGDDMAQLRMPKKPRKPNETGSIKIALPTQGVVSKVDGYLLTSKEHKVPKGTRRSAPGFDTVQEALEQTAERVVRRRQAKADKANAPRSQLTLAGVKATWAQAMLKAYPTVPAVVFSAREFAIFKQKVSTIIATCNLSEFFGWVVESWATLRATKFKWLRAQGKDVAPAPSLPELMRYWKVFAQAFADSRMLEATPTVSREDELSQKLEQAEGAAARAEAELRKTKNRLSRAERIAYSTPAAKPPTVPLSERMRRLEDGDKDDTPLPQWGD